MRNLLSLPSLNTKQIILHLNPEMNLLNHHIFSLQMHVLGLTGCVGVMLFILSVKFSVLTKHEGRCLGNIPD